MERWSLGISECNALYISIYYKQGASIAIVEDINYSAARESSTLTNASDDDRLFLDNDFPPSEVTLYHSINRMRDPQIVWLRPHELIMRPELLVDGVSRHDIVQGVLADCWFLSSCSAVAQRPDLMEKVIPSNQPLSGEGYKGIVTFRFWRFGRWVTVYVDDLLPTKKRKLIFSRSSEPREFWVSLLEKAYAKLHGSYEALEGGQAMDALVDLTGGLAEMYVLESAPPHLYNFLLQASSNGAFITCSRKGDWKETRKADVNGLVSGHAYTISAVATVKLSTGSEAYLVRIRNPWGNDTEWNGQWNDSDTNWHNVDLNTKEKIDYSKRGDGEFWMSYQDFCREFEEVTICSLTPDLTHHTTLKTNAVEVKDPVRQTVQNLLHIEEIGNSGPYVNYREVFGRFQMNPGHYIIVPATYEPDSPGSFYMRVYSDTQISLR
ncbi:calpain-B [Trichonephila inaurata madagascariensis]|uniref:Calpain-B n=1 Tax=Trichonephila inaurata madagascariensis TaxID=2747483 RepID=A0A8X7BVL7_9ARAC|nr:calpain-B [Trichonephila inaurata madagascariensis]